MEDNRKRIYMVPAADWLAENWWPLISGAPLTLRETPVLSLVSVAEADELNILGEYEHKISPFTLFIKGCEYLLSDLYGSSVYVMTFQNADIPFRQQLFTLPSSMEYVPHMILSNGLALTKSARSFLVSLANSLYNKEIVFDTIAVADGSTEDIYNPQIDTRDANSVV